MSLRFGITFCKSRILRLGWIYCLIKLLLSHQVVQKGRCDFHHTCVITCRSCGRLSAVRKKWQCFKPHGGRKRNTTTPSHVMISTSLIPKTHQTTIQDLNCRESSQNVMPSPSATFCTVDESKTVTKPRDHLNGLLPKKFHKALLTLREKAQKKQSLCQR